MAGRFAGGAALAVLSAGPAFAHASDRGFVLLLPTGHYIVGGALAVAASFLVLVAVPGGALSRLARLRWTLPRLPLPPRAAVSLLSFAMLALLVAAGLGGSRDPLSNPLPLTVWTLFWIGLTLASGVAGNLFAWLNPWYGPWRVACAAITPLWPAGHLPLKGGDRTAATLSPIANIEEMVSPSTLPISPLEGEMAGRPEGGAQAFLDRLGYAPAILQFLAFAWFELVYPAPDDPERLAWAVAGYWLVNFAAVLVFGYGPWARRGECFSVFFRMVSRLSPFELGDDRRLRLGLPGAKLSDAEPLPVGGVVFLLLVLGSVSFDGLMRTFAWLGLIGVNPLEFPGRSAVVWVNTAGLVALPVGLAAAFFLAVALGGRLAGAGVPTARAAGVLVWSLVPIALAYHFAHYLIALLVNGQYALVAISDPFSAGWNLFGTADTYVSAGLVMGPQAAWVLWNLQAGAIVGGHVLAVLAAHGLAARLYPDGRRLMLSQLPLALLMVGYTVFGLWLLSTPTGA